VARDGTDLDWAGALMVSDMLDDLKACRQILEAFAKGAAKGGRRRRR
jgi:hypothetical protein